MLYTSLLPSVSRAAARPGAASHSSKRLSRRPLVPVISSATIFGIGCAVIGAWSILSPVSISAIAVTVLLGVALLPARNLWLVAVAVVALLCLDLVRLSEGRIGEIEQQFLRVALAAEVEILLGLALGTAVRGSLARGEQAAVVVVSVAGFAAGCLAPIAEVLLATELGLAVGVVLPADFAGGLTFAADQARPALVIGGLVLLYGVSGGLARDTTPAAPKPTALLRSPVSAVVPDTEDTNDLDDVDDTDDAAVRLDAPADDADACVAVERDAVTDAAPVPDAPSAQFSIDAQGPVSATGLPDAGLPVRYRRLVPAQLLEDMKARFDAQATQLGIEIEILVGNGAFDHTAGDLHRLRAILDNLLRNALDHAGCQSLTLGYGQAAGQSPRIGVWTVSDDGRGFPAALAAEPELSTDFGLGLAIVRAAVDSLGGTLRFSSRQGHGSRFEILLPETDVATTPSVGEGRVVAYPARAAKAHAKGGAPMFDRRAARGHVLLVEDHPTLRAVAGALLGKVFGEVTLAGDAVTALSRFRDKTPDLVLVDLVMPGTGGDVLTKALRATSPELPIIGLLAVPNAAEARRLTDAGATEVVVKPLGRGQILDFMRRHVPPTADRAEHRAHG